MLRTNVVAILGMGPWAQFGGGLGGRVPPRFQVEGYNMPHPPTFFSSDFVFEVPKIKVTFVTFCLKCFSCYMLRIAKLMLKQSLVWHHWILLVYQF